MKTMMCKQLGGACDKSVQAAFFDEIAQLSKEHGLKIKKLLTSYQKTN